MKRTMNEIFFFWVGLSPFCFLVCLFLGLVSLVYVSWLGVSCALGLLRVVGEDIGPCGECEGGGWVGRSLRRG